MTRIYPGVYVAICSVRTCLPLTCLSQAMPFKPHLDLKILQCYPDIGGCDAWLGGFWDASSQWYTGWHQPGREGLQGLIQWKWPSDTWTLIGFERWEYRRKGDIMREAFYNYPNGSTCPNAPPATGHWHMKASPHGETKTWKWFPGALVEEEAYLKGGITGPKGGKGKDKGQGKGKGNWRPQGGKGKGKGQGNSLPKGGKGKGKGQGRSLPKGGKGDIPTTSPHTLTGSPSPEGEDWFRSRSLGEESRSPWA